MASAYCAGIVLFNPQLDRLDQVVGSIVSQVEMVLLVDNASGNVGEVENLVSHRSNVMLIKNSQNQGIATALNQICSFANDHHYSWVLTLDQDTICPVDMISKLSKHIHEDQVGILCPAVDYEGLNIQSGDKNEGLTETYACMTSGSFTNVEAWKTVGGFCDDYFIDFVDNEFCKKLKIHHYRILRVNLCVMSHQLGEAKTKRIFGIYTVKVCLHHPWRYYYMTRNNLQFIWTYKSYMNVMKEYAKLAYILISGVLYADKRIETLSYIKRGLRDACRGVTGRMPS